MYIVIISVFKIDQIEKLYIFRTIYSNNKLNYKE